MGTFRHAFEYVARGGWVMLPIAMCSVLTFAIILERAWALMKEKIIPRVFTEHLDQVVHGKNLTEITSFLRASANPLSRIVFSGLTQVDLGRQKVQEEMEMTAKEEVLKMEKFLDGLGSLAAVGPLLGLFGTVTGMIQTFDAVKVVGVGNPLELSGGISEALLSTAGGMVVGIPALIFQRYFLRKIDGFVIEMERVCARVVQKLDLK